MILHDNGPCRGNRAAEETRETLDKLLTLLESRQGNQLPTFTSRVKEYRSACERAGSIRAGCALQITLET